MLSWWSIPCPKKTTREEEKRRQIVEAVRRGLSQRKAAARFGVSVHTVQRWLARADKERLDRVDFSDRPRGGARKHTDAGTEDLILALRRELRDKSELGEYGAEAIRRALVERGHAPLPSVRTIGRILARRGALDGKRRVRRPPPPKGWYIPEVASGMCELDCFDLIEDLRIQRGPMMDVLTAISLHGGLPGAFPLEGSIRAVDIVDRLIAHWRHNGRPAYAQFDNDTVFQGPRKPDVLGRVIRLCLALGVTPIFAPQREHGVQNPIEGFNSQWREKVWHRFHHDSFGQLTVRSGGYIIALKKRRAARIDGAPSRKPFPANFRFDPAKPLSGEVIFIRRTDESGATQILGHRFEVSTNWQHRLVLATVDLDEHQIEFRMLRRREPDCRDLLKTAPYKFPDRPFHDSPPKAKPKKKGR